MLLEHGVIGDFFFCFPIGTNFIARLGFTFCPEVTIQSIRSSGGNKQHTAVLASLEADPHYQGLHQLIAQHIVDILQHHKLLHIVTVSLFAQLHDEIGVPEFPELLIGLLQFVIPLNGCQAVILSLLQDLG